MVVGAYERNRALRKRVLEAPERLGVGETYSKQPVLEVAGRACQAEGARWVKSLASISEYWPRGER